MRIHSLPSLTMLLKAPRLKSTLLTAKYNTSFKSVTKLWFSWKIQRAGHLQLQRWSRRCGQIDKEAAGVQAGKHLAASSKKIKREEAQKPSLGVKWKNNWIKTTSFGETQTNLNRLRSIVLQIRRMVRHSRWSQSAQRHPSWSHRWHW